MGVLRPGEAKVLPVTFGGLVSAYMCVSAYPVGFDIRGPTVKQSLLFVDGDGQNPQKKVMCLIGSSFNCS